MAASIAGGVTEIDLSRGQPATPVAPGGAIDALMDKFPNLYGDLSGTNGARAVSRDLKFGREFLIRRADRIVFGTDYHYVGQNVLQFDLFRELELPAETAQKIFRDNARRLLRI